MDFIRYKFKILHSKGCPDAFYALSDIFMLLVQNSGSSVVTVTSISINIQSLFQYLLKLRAVCIHVLKKTDEELYEGYPTCDVL
jgi:hypothetical protein